MTEPHAATTPKGFAARLRRAFRYRGLLVLVLWQAPVQPVIRPNGSLGFVVLGGTDEHAMISCDGDVIESREVSYRGAAIEADRDLGRNTRIATVAGYSGSDWGSHRGGFGAVQVRGDWGGFGIGLGVGILPGLDEFDADATVLPSGYMRAGSDDGYHLRIDVVPPTALGVHQIARVGLGYNAVSRDRASAFVGLAGVGYGSGATGVAADLTVPTASRFALRAQGHWAAGEEHSVTGIAVGGSYLFGGTRRVVREVQPAPGSR